MGAVAVGRAAAAPAEAAPGGSASSCTPAGQGRGFFGEGLVGAGWRQHSLSSHQAGDPPAGSCRGVCRLSGGTGGDAANTGPHGAARSESPLGVRASGHRELLRQTWANRYNRHQKYLQMRSSCIAACWVTGRAGNLSRNPAHVLQSSSWARRATGSGRKQEEKWFCSCGSPGEPRGSPRGWPAAGAAPKLLTCW